MLERLALALLIGGIAGYWLRQRQEPEIDWDEAFETITIADILTDLAAMGELVEWEGDTILQTRIEDEF